MKNYWLERTEKKELEAHNKLMWDFEIALGEIIKAKYKTMYVDMVEVDRSGTVVASIDKDGIPRDKHNTMITCNPIATITTIATMAIVNWEPPTECICTVTIS